MKNRVKELRKARGLRQEDVAALLGVSRQTVNAVENDKYDPTPVSYTHLDVYKRQAVNRPKGAPSQRGRLLVCYSRVWKNWRSNLAP